MSYCPPQLLFVRCHLNEIHIRGSTTLVNRYRAPEVLYGSKTFSPQVDLWAVGCILAEMGLRQPLCFGEREMTVLMKIIQVRCGVAFSERSSDET